MNTFEEMKHEGLISSDLSADDFIFDLDVDWIGITVEGIDTSGRWSYQMSRVVLHVPTSTFYKILWSVGATEYQEEEANVVFYKVEPVTATVVLFKDKG